IAALTLFGVTAPLTAQSAAVQSYNPVITGARGFFPAGWWNGWFFTPTQNLSVTGVGYFNPAGAIGGNASWVTAIVQAPPNGAPTVLGQGIINSASTPGAIDLIGGQFFYTALSSPLTLFAGTSYAVLVDGPKGTPVRSVFSGSLPLGVLDPRLTYGGLAEI